MKKDSVAFIIVGMIIKVVICVILLLALIYAARRAYSFGYSVFSQETFAKPPGKRVAVTIGEEMSDAEIAELLVKRELIKDANVFRVQYALSEYRGKIKPGSYVLNNSQTADEMLKILSGEDESEETEE